MKIVVDTNILIDFFRQKKAATNDITWLKLVALAKIKGYQLILPSAAVFELFAGEEMNAEANREKTELVLKDVLILDLTKEVALKAAALFRKHLSNIGPTDYFLAATAITLEAELATLNCKHFKIFKELKLFDLANLKMPDFN